MEEMLKIAVILGSLLIGFGVFYHYVIFLPSVENRKMQQAEKEKRESAEQANQRQLTYLTCMSAVGQDYDVNWATSCKNVALEQAQGLQNCMTDPSIISNPYMGRSYCQSNYGNSDPSPHCTLPNNRAGSINQAKRDAEQKCLSEARSNL